jgi:membrane-bound lytic murein transglycosylase B
MKLIRAAGIALPRMQSAGPRSPVRTWVALGALLLSLAPAAWAQTSASGAAETADARDPRPAPKAARGDQSRRAGKAGPAEGAGFAGRSDVRAFIDEMAATHDFDRATLTRAFRGARPLPAVIAAMDRPLLVPPKWYEYAPPLLAPARVDGGIAFLTAHRAALQRAEREYGVPPEIVVAIIGVETFYGANTGRHRTFDALATLAFDYPRRATFFRGELEHFLLLTRDLGADPLTPRGSFAGALGMPQFMPGSYRNFAVDFDADGRIDLWRSVDDVVGSVAAYLARHDWQRGQPILLPATVAGDGGALLLRRVEAGGGLSERRALEAWTADGLTAATPPDLAADPVGVLALERRDAEPELFVACHNFYVITRYNRSRLYAATVAALAQAIKAGER